MGQEGDPELPALGKTARDYSVAAGRGVFGGIPFIGAICSEIVTNVIPDQRMDRLEEYVTLLEGRLSAVEEENLNAKMRLPSKIDLFEEGAFQSARSLTPQRRDYIAGIVAKGIVGSDTEEAGAKRMLNLLGELDDDQIVMLAASEHGSRARHLRETHREVLGPMEVVLAASDEEKARATLRRANEQHLVRIGLLKPAFRRTTQDGTPEFDRETGMMKASVVNITPLGRLLLQYLDMTVNTL